MLFADLTDIRACIESSLFAASIINACWQWDKSESFVIREQNTLRQKLHGSGWGKKKKLKCN